MVMIADKWKLMVIHTLRLGGSKRNGELRRELDGISQKMLTQTLRSLERDGLIHRRDHQEIPPRVDYELTELGQTLCEPINLLGQWGLDNFTEIENARAKFDAQTKTASAT